MKLKTAVALALCVVSTGALAQAARYPSRPVRIVVGIAPGGGLDITARLVAAKMQDAWGQSVVVENKPGASAILAGEYVAKSPADGYTLLVNGTAGMTVNPAVYSKLPYDPVKDFSPVSNLTIFPMILVVHPSVPARNLQEFIAYAKANPGKLNYSAGTSFFQLASEMFKQMSATSINYIPYKGSAPAVNAVLTGEVQMTISDSAPITPLLKGGRVRGLGITTGKRVDSMPDLPTIGEAGVPGYEMVGWIGMFAPAGTPREVIGILNGEVTRILKLPDVREKLSALSLEASGTTPEQFAKIVRDDIARYSPVVKAANMRED
jgi:tripartite-type tricarboxylate transporter receptor subunit TctC